jgi:methyl-accepting chemotaxis protein
MSATSEELAAQAEELQASVAFFRTNASGKSAKRITRSAAPAAASKPAPRKPAVATGASGVAAQQARARGFALDLAQGGPDEDDAQFREYA